MINGAGESGCIPSKVRVERKEKLRMKQVKFSSKPNEQNAISTEERFSVLSAVLSKIMFDEAIL